MKIIVEEGDHWPGPPGTYEFHQTKTTANYPMDLEPVRRLGVARHISVELRGFMGSMLCGLCGERTCAKECPERIARDLITNKDLVKPGVVYLDTSGPVGGMVNQAILDVMARKREDLKKILTGPVTELAPRPQGPRSGVVDIINPSTCDECAGTGQWENPVTGRRSPCSRGCKP